MKSPLWTQRNRLFHLPGALAYSRDFLAHALPRIQWDGVDGAADHYLTLHAVFCGQVLTAPEPRSCYRVHSGSLAQKNIIIHRFCYHDTNLRLRVFNPIAGHYGKFLLGRFLNSRYPRQWPGFSPPDWTSWLARLARWKTLLPLRRSEALVKARAEHKS